MFLKECQKVLFYFFFFLQHWEVFKKVTEVFILVPALLGLKGNLEMTLASRLSTAVSFFLLLSIDIAFAVLFCEGEFVPGNFFPPLSDKFLDLRDMVSGNACFHTLKVLWVG